MNECSLTDEYVASATSSDKYQHHFIASNKKNNLVKWICLDSTASL